VSESVPATTRVGRGRRASSGPSKRSRSRFDREALTAYAFIAPCMLGFTLFYLLPALRAIWISFTDWDLLSPAKWIGFENYRAMVQDDLFWNAIRVTFKYVLWNIPAQTVLGLFLAFMLHRVATAPIWRSLVIFPYLLSNVMAALVFVWVFDPSLGFANQLLRLLHLPELSFFGSETGALRSIAFVNIWRHMGLTALLFFAGMQAIPGSIYEAAKIDGAGEWAMFRRITLPLLRPVSAFVVITSLVGSFQIFDTVLVATRPPGGPIDTTRFFAVYINAKAFGQFQMGYASALSVALFFFLAVIAIVQLRLFRGDRSELA
jgi:multiple sugar transport system permease protein